MFFCRDVKYLGVLACIVPTAKIHFHDIQFSNIILSHRVEQPTWSSLRYDFEGRLYTPWLKKPHPRYIFK